MDRGGGGVDWQWQAVPGAVKYRFLGPLLNPARPPYQLVGIFSPVLLPKYAEALAGLFLAAYVGLAGPVIGLGALTQIASTRISLLVFASLLALGILAATPALLGHGGLPSAEPQPTST